MPNGVLLSLASIQFISGVVIDIVVVVGLHECFFSVCCGYLLIQILAFNTSIFVGLLLFQLFGIHFVRFYSYPIKCEPKSHRSTCEKSTATGFFQSNMCMDILWQIFQHTERAQFGWRGAKRRDQNEETNIRRENIVRKWQASGFLKDCRYDRIGCWMWIENNIDPRKAAANKHLFAHAKHTLDKWNVFSSIMQHFSAGENFAWFRHTTDWQYIHLWHARVILLYGKEQRLRYILQIGRFVGCSLTHTQTHSFAYISSRVYSFYNYFYQKFNLHRTCIIHSLK